MGTEKAFPQGLAPLDAMVKRGFDLLASLAGLLFVWWLIGLAWFLATLDTRQNGMFVQKRVGRYGRLFNVYKIRTMRPSREIVTHVTTDRDPRITPLGRFFRKTKIDELPQLVNVLVGRMSFVGPRPDMPGFADTLTGEDAVVLTVRPGITGPATLKYKNEEALLAEQSDPEKFNREVIWPDKVRINREYVANWGFWKDIKYIFQTITG